MAYYQIIISHIFCFIANRIFCTQPDSHFQSFFMKTFHQHAVLEAEANQIRGIDPGYGPLHPYIHRGSVRVLQETSGHRAADWRRRADRGGQHGLGSYWTCMSVLWVFIMAYCICIWISLHRSPFVPLRYQEPPRAPGLACVPILPIYTRRCAVRRRWLWAWWTHTFERGWSGFDSSRRTWPYCCHRCPLPVCTARKHCSRYRLDHPTQSVGSKQFRRLSWFVVVLFC